jgi:2-iminobutanoate/2-iminopropanoate deaminase
MPKQVIHSTRAPKPLAGYSQAVKAAGLIFVSGQGPFHPETGAIVGATIEEQARQCLTNIRAILEDAGRSMDDIVSATFILDDPNDFAGLNAEWARWFTHDPPARQGAKLPLRREGLKISIAAVAEA